MKLNTISNRPLYSTLGETDRFCFKILIYFLNTLKIAFHEIFQIFEHYSVSKCFTILKINVLNKDLLTDCGKPWQKKGKTNRKI